MKITKPQQKKIDAFIKRLKLNKCAPEPCKNDSWEIILDGDQAIAKIIGYGSEKSLRLMDGTLVRKIGKKDLAIKLCAIFNVIYGSMDILQAKINKADKTRANAKDVLLHMAEFAKYHLKGGANNMRESRNEIARVNCIAKSLGFVKSDYMRDGKPAFEERGSLLEGFAGKKRLFICVEFYVGSVYIYDADGVEVNSYCRSLKQVKLMLSKFKIDLILAEITAADAFIDEARELTNEVK